jgi:hypothetical protein
MGTELTEEIISEWTLEVLAVGMPFRPGTTEFVEWKRLYDIREKIIKMEAAVLRNILDKKLGPECKGCALHGRFDE